MALRISSFKNTKNFKWDRSALAKVLAMPEKAVGIIAEAARAGAVSTAPVGVSGDLRGAITAYKGRPSKRGDPVWIVEANKKYVSHLELGTRNVPRQPFMRPAMVRSGKAAAARLRDLVK